MESELIELFKEGGRVFFLLAFPFFAALTGITVLFSLLQGFILLKDPVVNFAARFVCLVVVATTFGVQFLPMLLEFTKNSLSP